MKNQEKEKFILITIGVLAALVRVWVFLQNRSLWLDEANLALNIVEKDYSQFFFPLDYYQHAPPLYLILCKFSTFLFGISEWSLRLPSFIAGLLSILLFYKLVLFLIKHTVVKAYTLSLFAFSQLLITYASELKQYEIDGTIALALIYLALKFTKDVFDSKHFILWSLVGGISIWLSMPSIIVLATIGLFFLIKAIRSKNRMAIFKICGVGVIWVVSFSLYYFTVLQYSFSDSSLNTYHTDFFFDLLPSSREDFEKNYNLVTSILTSIADPTFITQIWVMICISFGVIFTWKKNKSVLFLLGLPIAITLILSHFQGYSLIARLTLFFIPFAMLWVGIGSDIIWSSRSRYLKFIVSVIMILGVYNKNGFFYFFETLENTNNKEALLFIKENSSDNEKIFINPTGRAAFTFYNNYHKNAFHFPAYFISNFDTNLEEKILANKEVNEATTCWLFLSHAHEIDVQAFMRPILNSTQIVEQYKGARVRVYKLEYK